LAQGKSTVDSVCAFVSRRYAYLKRLIPIKCKSGHARVGKKTALKLMEERLYE
jgi:hypothetical protein